MKNITITILSIILLTTFVSSLEISLLTPSSTFRVNQSDIVNDYIKFHNPNNLTVNVLLLLPNDLNINLNNTEFELEPNETKKIEYTILAEETISTRIGVTFFTNDSSIGLQKKINLIVTEKPFSINNHVGVILILFLLFLSYLIFREKINRFLYTLSLKSL